MLSLSILPYATGGLSGSMSTRNALYSGVSIFASPTTDVSEFGPKPFFVSPMKPQCKGDADDVDRLAVDQKRLDALRDDRFGFDRAALRPNAHPAAFLDALLLRKFFRDLDEELRLQDRVDQGVLRPEVEVLG